MFFVEKAWNFLLNVLIFIFKSVTLYDKNQCTCKDLGLQFFIRQEDVESKLKRYPKFFL